MDGYIVGSMISANSITGEQIQANSIKTANLEVDVQEKITSATDEETVKTLIKADLDGFQVNVSNTYETKTNVETKVASTLNSAKSYADTKKNEAISSANNTLNTTIANYYTKEQTDSRINVAKDAINLGVSQTYETKANVESKINGIQIGGRNLILNSKTILLNGSDNGNSNCSVVEEDYVKISPKNNGNVYNTAIYTSVNRMQGETYTLSFDILTPTRIGFYWYPSEHYSKPNYINADDKWQRVSFTYTQINADSTSTSAQLFGLQGLVGGQIYKYRNLKLEIGNKATDWIPAPEDIDSAIDKKANSTDVYKKTEVYTKSETDSKITIAKDEINLGVSNTYETKTNVTTKINGVNDSISSLTTRMTNAESKITDTAITNTVKQNFYTKEETNNQITSKGYQTESQVQQTVNTVKFSFQESGGYNLLKNSKWDAKKEQWTFTNDSYVSVIEDAAAGTNYLRCQTVNGATHGCSQTIKVEKDNTYVASAKVDFDNGAIAVLRVQVNGSTYYAKTNQASQYRNKVLFVSFPVTTSGDAVITLYTDSSSTTGKYARFRYSQVELGSEFSPWSPNPYEIYGGVATIDKDKVRIQHDNGSYSQMAVSGFKRFDSGAGRDYHYLSSNGVVNVSNGTPVTVTLPSEFKGKDFKVTLSIFKVNIPSGVGWNGIYDIDSYTSNVDRSNAKFTVEAMVKSVNGQYGTVDISYVVIA